MMGWMVEGANAQLYKVTLDGRVWPGGSTYDRKDCSNNIDIHIEFTDGSQAVLLPTQNLNDGDQWPQSISTYFDAKKTPKQIITRTSRNWYRDWGLFGSCGGNGAFDDIRRYTAISYCENKLNGVAEWWGTQFDLKIYPEISILPPEVNPQEVRIIPSDDPFVLKATKGFPPDTYKWEYQVGMKEEEAEGNKWLPVPKSEGKDELSFTGYELMAPEEFDALYGQKNIFFRIAPCEGFATSITIATPKLSSPHIVSIQTMPTTCSDDMDGSMHIQFDRALRSGETLNLTLADDRHDDAWNNITTFNRGNTLNWAKELAPATYGLGMIGKYNGIPTYTEGKGHSYSPRVTSPDPVMFKVAHKDVSCFAGNDATITVTASGGVGKYVVAFRGEKDSEYKHEAFSNGSNNYIIKGLTSGTYKIRLNDGNGCRMKNKKGKEETKTIEIKQPTKAIKIDNSTSTDPLAFGYTDGSITAIIVGGTPIDGTSYNVTWTNNSSGEVLSSVTNTVNPFTTTLYNIGKGDYKLSVTDANYASTPSGAPTGCIVEEIISLDEPPQLEVAIEEHHFINCKGMSNGELKAVAKGGIEIPRKRYIYEWFRQTESGWELLKSQKEDIATHLRSAVYQVQITDKNGISQKSEPFHLVEPEKLTVVLNSSPSACSGSKTGHITATVAGGTPPYRIEWNTGSASTTTANIIPLESLLAGNYFALVSDSRACRAEAKIAVTTPNPIELKEIKVTEPTCSGGFDGSIHFNTIGGTPPYTYLWTNTTQQDLNANKEGMTYKNTWMNGANTAHVSGLCAGVYTLLLTDAQGCSLEQQYKLRDPEPLKIELGPDRTLCQGQAWEADIRIPDPSATYAWTGPNGFTATTPAATLKDEGTYQVLVTDHKGCQANDTMTIHRSDAVIAAEYTAATHAFVGDPIIFININDSRPENVEWVLPENPSVQVLNKNKKLLELAFTDAGSYDVAIRSTVGDCEKVFKKSITVLNKDEAHNPGSNVAPPFIRTFQIGPNPSNGTFTVDVELERTAPISLRLVHVHTGATIDLKKQTGSNRYTIPYNLQLASGSYVLILETAKENRVFRVIIW